MRFRQIWWGHRIPAWTWEDCGEVIVAREEPSQGNARRARDHCSRRPTSWIRGFRRLSGRFPPWVGRTRPGLLHDLLSHIVSRYGFDILFLLGRPHDDDGPEVHGKDVPFREVYISRSVRDEPRQEDEQVPGQRHRSAGGHGRVRHGRRSFHSCRAGGSGPGYSSVGEPHRRVPEFHEQDLERRPIRIALPGYTEVPGNSQSLTLTDRWILSRLNRTIQEVHKAIETYRFNDAAHPCISSRGMNSATGSSNIPRFRWVVKIRTRNGLLQSPCAMCWMP